MREGNWHSIPLGDGLAAFKPTLDAMQAVYAHLVTSGGADPQVALFSKSDTATGNVTLYFAPGAEAVAHLFDAAPCEKPENSRLSLLVGTAHSWTLVD